MDEYADKKRKMNEELIERLRITEQMLNVAHFKEAESLIREACDAIEELQSKLIASRRLKKGKWIHIGGDEWLCDECGFILATEGCWEHPLDAGNYYCKNCGADMRGE